MFGKFRNTLSEFHTRLMATGATLSVSSLGAAVWSFHAGDVASAFGWLTFVVTGGLFVGIGSAERRP